MPAPGSQVAAFSASRFPLDLTWYCRGAVAELLDSMIASLVPYELDGSFIPRMKESSKRKGPIAETKSFTPDGKASELRTLAANGKHVIHS